MSFTYAATPSEIATVLSNQNYTFTPDQIATKTFQTTRKNGNTVNLRIYKGAVDSLIQMMNTISGSKPTIEHQRILAALQTISLSSARGRGKLTKERLERETPRYYSVTKQGHAVVPVAAWFGINAASGKNKVTVSYGDNGILITYKK